MGPVLASLLVAAAANGMLLAWSHEDPGGWHLEMRPVWAWSHIFRVLFFRALWDILLVAIVVAVLLVLRRVVGRRDHARDVIRERYGRGEIGKAEFDTKRADLKHT